MVARPIRQEVLERAASESASALLIYAHADALAVQPDPLSKPLDDFVKKDGWNFQEELQRDANGWEDMVYESTNDVAKGTWDDPSASIIQNQHPPSYETDWNTISGPEYHHSTQHNRHDSNLSSATLTANTDHDDLGVQEMVEINGGMDALTGVSSHASSSTVQGDDRMDVDETRHGKIDLMDTKMDVPRDGDGEGPRVQHIEVAGKKKGG